VNDRAYLNAISLDTINHEIWRSRDRELSQPPMPGWRRQFGELLEQANDIENTLPDPSRSAGALLVQIIDGLLKSARALSAHTTRISACGRGKPSRLRYAA
jgi:hypothetical protein